MFKYLIINIIVVIIIFVTDMIYILLQFITRKKLDIPNDLIDGTIHCKEGAGMLLICRIYEILTNRP